VKLPGTVLTYTFADDVHLILHIELKLLMVFGKSRLGSMFHTLTYVLCVYIYIPTYVCVYVYTHTYTHS